MSNKVIDITGTNNKYHLKNQINNYKKEIKKRIQPTKWAFQVDHYNHASQLNLIIDISNNGFKWADNASKVILQEINRKICGYKQQDKLKKHYEEDNFIKLQTILGKMIETELKCRYCLNEMFVLYDISREKNQWTVDRIDNDTGHRDDNFHLACLECNLKRRRRTDEKYLFTKQMKLIKRDNDNNIDL